MKLRTSCIDVHATQRLLAAADDNGDGVGGTPPAAVAAAAVAATATATAAVVVVSAHKLKTKNKLDLEVFSAALSVSYKKMIDSCIGKDRGNLDPMQVCFKRLLYLKITSSTVLEKRYILNRRALSLSFKPKIYKPLWALFLEERKEPTMSSTFRYHPLLCIGRTGRKRDRNYTRPRFSGSRCSLR